MLRMKSEWNPVSDNKTRKRFLGLSALCAFGLVLSGLQNSAHAQLKPFKITGAGLANYIPLPGDGTYHFSVGTATGLGEYFGEGNEQTIAFTSANTASFSSSTPFIFTGANGDKLACHYGRTDFGAAEVGEVTLTIIEIDAAGNLIVTAEFVAEFTPVFEECTGKFEEIIGGSFIMVANTEPFVFGDTTTPVLVSWEGEGAFDWATPERNWRVSATGFFAPDPDNPGVDLDVFGGYSSQLGKFTGSGSHRLHPDFTVTGTATWTAANGDTLDVSYAGNVFPSGDPEFPFGAVAEFTVVGGTGRFANATGRGTMVAGFNTLGELFFDLEGTLHH